MSTSHNLEQLQKELDQFYAENIPAAQQMQAQLTAYNDEFLTLSAPLEVNHNDHGNAFGGSLFNLAVLAGWTALHLECKKTMVKPHIVARDAQIRYRHPVNNTIISAECKLPNPRQWDGFFAHYEKSGQTTISLACTIKCKDEIAARLETVFVLLSK